MAWTGIRKEAAERLRPANEKCPPRFVHKLRVQNVPSGLLNGGFQIKGQILP
jgi:hypothetical protein